MKTNTSSAGSLRLALLALVGVASTSAVLSQVVITPGNTNGNVQIITEYVSSMNPGFYRLDQFTTAPDLQRGVGVASWVNLGGGNPNAGAPLAALTDGLAPVSASLADLLAASVYSSSGSYGLLFDLGSVQRVTSITTYSVGLDLTHVNQNYQVWGSDTLLPIQSGWDPYGFGWTRLAIGTTGGWNGVTSGAVAINLTGVSGSLGDFRYLLFGMQDTSSANAQGAKAYLPEITILTAVPEPSTYALTAASALLGVAMWRRFRPARRA